MRYSNPLTKLTAIAAVLAICAVAVAPANAGNAARAKTGISLLTIYKNGKAIKVKKFNYTNLPLQCKQGTTKLSPGKALPAMKIKDNRTFNGKFVPRVSRPG